MSYSYIAISNYYQNKQASRTKIPYMKHIDDGARILQLLGVTDHKVMDAWFLHPLTQSMTDHQINAYLSSVGLPALHVICDADTVSLARQYADVANSFLPLYVDRDEHDTFNIYIMCPKLKALLIADKVQNYVDFCMSADSNKFDNEPSSFIPNRMEYFNMWLGRLDIDEVNFEPLRECVSRDYPWND